jgi:hypothetical protein
MSWGLGTYASEVAGYGDADSWGGPVNGIDVVGHISDDFKKASKGGSVSSDTYMFIIVMAAVAALWLLGGVVFKSARL